jgi:hypothetical protein
VTSTPTTSPVTSTPSPVTTTTTPQLKSGPSYIIATSTGQVFGFGGASGLGSSGTGETHQELFNGAVVGSSLSADDEGYWLVTSGGAVYSFGDANFYGGLNTGRGGLGLTLAAPVVGIANTPDARGYWLVSADGGVFAMGDAVFFGSCPATGSHCPHLDAPVVGIRPTRDGRGYWLVAKDGGVFAFGDATYRGSKYQLDPSRSPGGSNSVTLNAPVVAIATLDNGGYWVAGSKGQVLAFGRAPHLSGCPVPNSGCPSLGQTVVAIEPTSDGKGFWLFGADGGVYAFGDALFEGSATGQTGGSPAV